MVSISGGQSIRWSFLRIHKGLLFVYQSAINASNLFLFSLKQVFVVKLMCVCIFSLAYYSKQKNTIQTYSVESRKNVTRKQGGGMGGGMFRLISLLSCKCSDWFWNYTNICHRKKNLFLCCHHHPGKHTTKSLRDIFINQLTKLVIMHSYRFLDTGSGSSWLFFWLKIFPATSVPVNRLHKTNTIMLAIFIGRVCTNLLREKGKCRQFWWLG